MRKETNPRRMLWFPYSQRGALYPIMPAIESLRRHDTQVTACGPRSFKAFADSHGIPFIAYRSTVDYDWSRADTVDPRSRGAAQGAERFLERTRAEFTDADATIAEYAPDVVLSDSLFLGGGLAAERRGVPWASYVHYLFDERAETDDLQRHWWNRPGTDALDTFIGWWTSVRRTAGIGPDPRPRDQALWYRMAPHLTVVLTHPELKRRGRPLPDYVRRAHLPPWNEPSHDRGPSAGPALLPSWAGRAPRVLVANSSAWQADVDLVRATVSGLENTGIEVIATIAAEHRVAVEESSRVTVLDYFPHTDLLPLVDAVVTTSGAGVVGKALWFGKPVVAVPFARDQHLVAEALVESGLGRSVATP